MQLKSTTSADSTTDQEPPNNIFLKRKITLDMFLI
jgi:hypothetical protein